MSSTSDSSSELWIPKKVKPFQETVLNVDKLASSLKKTTSNLRAVDKLLEKYQDLDDEKYAKPPYKEERMPNGNPYQQPIRNQQDFYKPYDAFTPNYINRRSDGFMSDYGNYRHTSYPNYSNYRQMDHLVGRDHGNSRNRPFDEFPRGVAVNAFDTQYDQKVEQKLDETMKELKNEKQDWIMKHKEILEIKQSLEKQKADLESMMTQEKRVNINGNSRNSEETLNRAIDRLHIENSEIHQFKNVLDSNQKEIAYLKENANKILFEKEKLETENKLLAKDLENSMQQLKNFEFEKQNFLSKFQSMDDKLKDCLAEKQSVEKELNDMRHEYKALSSESSKEIKRLHDSKKKSKQKSRRVRNEMERLVMDNQDLQHQTDILRQQIHNNANNPSHAIFFDKLKRELDEALFSKVTAEEQIRAKEIEISEFKSVLTCLNSELKDSRLIVDRLEKELQLMNSKYNRELQEKCNLVNQNKRLQHNSPENFQIKKDLMRLKASENNLTIQVTNLTQIKQDLSSKLQATLSELSRTKEEMTAEKLMLEKEIESNHSKLRILENELKILKSRDETNSQEKEFLIQQLQLDSTAELDALKLELSEEQKKNGILKKQIDDRILNLNQKLDNNSLIFGKNSDRKSFMLSTNSPLKIDQNDIKRINEEFKRRLEEISHVREILQQITPNQLQNNNNEESISRENHNSKKHNNGYTN